MWPFLPEPPSLRQILLMMPWRLAPRVGRGGVHWGCLGACGQKTPHPSVCLERKTPQASPREEKPSKNGTKKKRKLRSTRRQRKRVMTIEEAPAVLQQCHWTRASKLLVGDSLVVREAGSFFSQLRPANSARAFPGTRVKRVVEEVAELDLNRNNALLLTIGGNDPFLKNGKCRSLEGLVGNYDRLIRTTKSKTSCLMVVGIFPRKYRSRENYSRALGVNQKPAPEFKAFQVCGNQVLGPKESRT